MNDTVDPSASLSPPGPSQRKREDGLECGKFSVRADVWLGLELAIYRRLLGETKCHAFVCRYMSRVLGVFLRICLVSTWIFCLSKETRHVSVHLVWPILICMVTRTCCSSRRTTATMIEPCPCCFVQKRYLKQIMLWLAAWNFPSRNIVSLCSCISIDYTAYILPIPWIQRIDTAFINFNINRPLKLWRDKWSVCLKVNWYSLRIIWETCQIQCRWNNIHYVLRHTDTQRLRDLIYETLWEIFPNQARAYFDKFFF